MISGVSPKCISSLNSFVISLYVLPLQIHEGKSSYRRPYNLEVKGHVGSTEVFSNSTQLYFNPKGLSTFIQTDKLNYLPGQLVKIRAVSIHPDGKPYVSPVDIVINVSLTSGFLIFQRINNQISSVSPSIDGIWEGVVSVLTTNTVLQFLLINLVSQMQ